MTEENKGIEVPGEAESSQANPTDFETRRDEAIKDRARKLGWRPKQEYDGDPSEWRSAKEFMERQSFFDKIKSVKDDLYHARKENKQLQKDLSVIKDYVQKMSKVEYERAIADLTAQKMAAVQESNVEEVRRLDAQIDTIRESKVTPAAQVEQPAGPPPEFYEWTMANKWYDEDNELRTQADELGLGIMAKNPGLPIREVLRQVEVKVKKMYPEKFPTGTRKPSAASVEAGGASAGGTSTKSKSRLAVSDLDDTQRKAMDAFVKRGVLTQEQYLDQLSKSMGMK